MICRIATFNSKPNIDEEQLRGFRAWMKEQPGFVAAYHVSDPATGKSLSISFWESPDHLRALKHRTPPFGALGLTPDTVETFPVVEPF